MKLKLSALCFAMFTLPALAAGPASTTPATPSAPAASSATASKASSSDASTTPSARVDSNQVPLNKYGAVNSKAKIPLSAQITPAPENFVQPSYPVAADMWKSAVPLPPALAVNSYVLMTSTGNVIAAFNGNTRVAPASLTKLMLLYIVDQHLATGALHLEDKLTVPTVAWATGGSRMFLKPKQQVTVRDLISGVIVDSGNDAAVTLAVRIAGTQEAFVEMMNQNVKRLGMTNTHFATVMGLPAPNQYTSAYDMAILAHAIVSQYPQYLDWYNQKSFSYNGINQNNFNKLLFTYKYAQGLKTGSTGEAGFSLVSLAQMPDNPMQLIGAVMGATNGTASAASSKALLSYGFKYFTYQKLYTAGSIVGQAPVKNGMPASIPVTVAQDLTVIYPSSLSTKLQAELKATANLVPPIQKGAQVGNIVVTANGQVIATVPAVAAQDIAKASMWQRIKRKFGA